MNDKFIILRNDIVWDVERNKNTMVNINELYLEIIIYLQRKTDLDELCGFTIENMVSKCGYKPNNNKGKINSKFKECLGLMQNNGYLNCDISLFSIKDKTYIECELSDKMKFKLDNEGNKTEYFKVNLESIKKIYSDSSTLKKSTLLKTYCYICSRIKKRTVAMNEQIKDTSSYQDTIVEETHFNSIDIEDDLNMNKDTFLKAIDRLKEIGLIYYGNIGYVKLNNLKHIANNVYALNKEDYLRAIQCSKQYYKDKGYELLGNKNKIKINNSKNGKMAHN